MNFDQLTPEQKWFNACQLKVAIDLHRKTGIIPTRGVTITKMFAQASLHTGHTYKRGQHADAILDLEAIIAAGRP